MKTIRMIKMALIALTGTLSLTSCGGSADATDAESLEKAGIAEAEKKVEIKDSPIFGKLPYIWQQEKTAKSVIDSIADAAEEALGDKEAAETRKAISDAKNEARDKVWKSYADKFGEAGKELIGKELPVKFDASQFSAAKVTVKEIKEYSVNIEYSVTLAAPLKDNFNFGYASIDYCYIDGDGKEISPGTHNVDFKRDGITNKAGSVITFTGYVTFASKFESDKVAGIYFKKE